MRPEPMTGPQAEALAVQALGWMAGDEELFGRFLATTGAGPGDLRTRASDPEFLGFVLDFLLAEEAALLAFAAAERIRPELPMQARAALPGGALPNWTWLVILPMTAEAIEASLDPDVLTQLRALPIVPGRPLLAVDADEVMVYLAAHLERYLPTIGYRIQLTQYQLEGSIFPAGSEIPVPFDDCLRLIDRFFDEETLKQVALPGAVEALARLSALAQVVVLTNVPRHASDMRRRNLAGLGMDYPLVVNAGGKGRALFWIAAKAAAPVAFIDDSPKQLESAARRAPAVTRIHFVGAGHLRRILPESPAAHHRVEGWEACEAVVRNILKDTARQ